MAKAASYVPATVEELAAGYQKLILFFIHRVSRGKVREDDVPDLLQAIYLRVWEKNYLDRCRQLLAERGGAFNTYLWWLVRSVCCNQFRQNRKNPVNTAYRAMDPRSRPSERRATKYRDGIDLERLGPRFGQVDVDFEARMEQRDQLERFAQFVSTTQDGAQLTATLQSLWKGLETQEIAAEQHVPRSTVRARARELRALRGVYLQRVG